MKRRPPSTALRAVTIRCTEVDCRPVREYGFAAWSERKAIHAANQACPWRCGKHPQEARRAA